MNVKKELDCIFIDLEKASDKIKKSYIIFCENIGFDWLINILSITYDRVKAYIRINWMFS